MLLVLANIGNYRGLQLIKSKYKNTSFLDELYQILISIISKCHIKKINFFILKKEIYDHLNDKSFYSGQLQWSKSLVIENFY